MSVIADAQFSAADAIAEGEPVAFGPDQAQPALPLSLSRHLPLVEDALRWALPATSSPLGKMCAYHLGWVSPDGTPTGGGGGKLFRAALTLWACEACGGEVDWAVSAAAAVELIHNFTLVHDDIQDGDATRRHRPTVWAIWGQAQGINAGDGLFATAYMALLAPGPRADRRMRAARGLSQAVLEVIEGQSLDLALEGRPDTPRATYVRLITAKTGALLGACMEMGAILAGASPRTVTKLRNAGRLLGETFQIRDDWLGSFGDPDRTGKGRTSDLGRRKLTYPVVSAFSRASYAEQRRLCQLYADPEAEDGESQIREILSSLGEPAATAVAATQTVNASMSAVASSGLEARWVDDFAAIARFVAQRTG